MKRYQSHKVVEAAPIIAAEFNEDGSGKVAIKDDAGVNTLTIDVPAGFKRPNTDPSMSPDGGDYLVRYQPDGYLSWSPKSVFEEGYRAIEAGDYRDRVRQERADLDEKLTKLERFIATVECPDSLLKSQADAMRAYVRILDARIAAFPDGPVLSAEDLIAAGKAARSEAVIDNDLTQIHGVTVVVSAPPGQRAEVALSRAVGSARSMTVVGGQAQKIEIDPGDTLVVCTGERHSIIDGNTVRDYRK